jgi:hypothetical protein
METFADLARCLPYCKNFVCEGGDGGTHNISANLLLQLLNNGVDMADAKPWPVVPAMSVGAENWNDARGLGESHYAKVQP